MVFMDFFSTFFIAVFLLNFKPFPYKLVFKKSRKLLPRIPIFMDSSGSQPPIGESARFSDSFIHFIFMYFVLSENRSSRKKKKIGFVWMWNICEMELEQ